MPIILDTIESAELDIGMDDSSAVRAGVATDIPATARNDPFVLARALIEMGGPALGSSHPYVGSMYLHRISARPAAGTNDAALQYHYKGPGQGPNSAGAAILVIEDDTNLAVEQEELDLLGRPIQAIFEPSGQTAEESSPKRIRIAKTVSVAVERPRRVLTVSGLLFGRKAPNAWSRDAVGYVNDSPWPTGSLWREDLPDPAGHWLCSHVSASTDRYQYQVFDTKLRPYRVRASFKNKVYRDWGSLGIYRNDHGNIPKEIAGDPKGKITPEQAAKAIRDVINSPYDPNVQNHNANGFVKACMYKTSPFSRVFGF